MHTNHTVLLAALLALVGCAAPGSPHTGASPASAVSESASNMAAVLTRTWHCRERTLLWELKSDGQWKWWEVQEPSGHPSEPAAISGTWFIHDGILVLRVQ